MLFLPDLLTSQGGVRPCTIAFGVIPFVMFHFYIVHMCFVVPLKITV